jgi:AT hook motif
MDIAQTTPLAALEALADEELRAVIAQATQLLAAREIERRKQALAQIRQIARENGLTVSVKEPARKRGRPRKNGDQA